MKRMISIMLVVILVMGSLAVYAETMTYGEELYDMRLILGDENGNLHENDFLTRAEMMVVIAQLNGVVDEAENFAWTSSFLDVSPTAWYASIVAYAQYQEWTYGYGDGNFGPMDTLNSNHAATFLLRILGYKDPEEFVYTRAIEFARSLGIEASIGNPNQIRRGELFELMYRAVYTETKNGRLLGEELGVFESRAFDLNVSSKKLII